MSQADTPVGAGERVLRLGSPLVRAARAGAAAVIARRPDGFELDGRRYRYFVHPYNATWRNERAVELPVALALLDESRGARVLEVGNVLVHYGRRGHDVVDKYEPSPDVIALDIVDFRPERPYDVIVAISTLEHVGFDEDVRDPAKPRRAVEHMASLLAPGGRMLVTVPLGYNEALDRDLLADGLGFDRVGFLERTSRLGRWREVPAATAAGARYGHPYRWANAVAVAERRAPGP
jgi:SAM-dependent methyltransferase